MTSPGRALLLDRSPEHAFQEHVFTLAARGGWHGAHIRLSHGTLEGLHSPRRPYPRAADHDDAWGIPDLVLVHPVRGLLLLPELKTPRGVVSPDQRRWLGWLSNVDSIQSPIWRPSMEETIRAVLLG
jgi:hypothetical protein